MALTSPASVSFNGGELTPLLHARVDQSVRSIAVKRMLGWLPTLQGPAEACPGTVFVAAARGPHRLIPFRFNVTQHYMIEAGEHYARFFTNDAPILTGGAPYELATPWTLAQVRGLYTEQSLDVLYCAHAAVPLQALARTGADSFAVTPAELRNGPFDTRNVDRAITVTASAATGTVTLTASAPIFDPGDVSGLFEIEGGSFADIRVWEVGMTVVPGMTVQSGENVYLDDGGEERTGQVAPVHIEGTEWDGMGGEDVNEKVYGRRWTYLHNRYGLLRLTGFVSATEMTAEVLTHLPTTEASWRWRFGAFSPRRGYPQAVAVWQERLILAQGSVIHASVAGDLTDFSPRNEFGDASRDMAFSLPLPNPDVVRWMLSDFGLVIGTASAEHVLVQSSQGQGAGPGNVDPTTPTTTGSAAGRAVQVGGRAVFLQKARAKLVQLAYDTNRLLREESPDLSRFADHIGAAGMADLTWCQEPRRLLWVRRDDGTLAACAFDPAESLLGWATRALGDGLTATGIASILDPDGRFDQLWISAELAGRPLVLRMAPLRATGDAGEQVMLDAAVRWTGGQWHAISAPHLAGRTVDVLADGLHLPGLTADGAGTVTLEQDAGDIIVGLPFPNEMRFLPPAGGSESGPALGKRKRASRIDVGYLNAGELELSCQGSVRRANHLTAADAFAAPPLQSGRARLEPTGDLDDDMEITVRRVEPRPATLTYAMPFYDVGQG